MNNLESIFLKEFENIGALFILSFIVAAAIILLSLNITVSIPDPEKSSSYECGFDPYGDARNMFDVRFYLVAILFIVFDLESIYFFPWCVSFNSLSSSGFFSMLDFVLELLIGYIYVWQIGGLSWSNLFQYRSSVLATLFL
jgi:NADH-quinone oxidoreductase subunit A